MDRSPEGMRFFLNGPDYLCMGPTMEITACVTVTWFQWGSGPAQLQNYKYPLFFRFRSLLPFLNSGADSRPDQTTEEVDRDLQFSR